MLYLVCLVALHPQKFHAKRVFNYEPYEKELNIKGLIFSLKVTDVKKFDKLNCTLSINVFAIDNKTVHPIHLTVNKEASKFINLLVIIMGENWHYTLIKNMSTLLSSQKSRNEHKKYWCYNSLHSLTSEERSKRHAEDCCKNSLQKIILPDEKHQCVEFDSVEKMLPVPFIIYADFESF